MIRINLLPHREEKRLARQRQFYVLAAGVAVLSGLLVLAVHGAIDGRISYQNSRNQYLDQQIASLDQQIAEIKKLKDQTQALLARKKVVETLQTNRSLVVHLMDQLVRQLPEGIYLKSISEKGDVVTLTGYAQSNARVSTLMRNLDASPWLESPELIEIKAATVNGQRANEFSLTVKLVAPQTSDSDGSKAAPGTGKPAAKP